MPSAIRTQDQVSAPYCSRTRVDNLPDSFLTPSTALVRTRVFTVQALEPLKTTTQQGRPDERSRGDAELVRRVLFRRLVEDVDGPRRVVCDGHVESAPSDNVTQAPGIS